MTTILEVEKAGWMKQFGLHQESFDERLRAAGLHFEGKPYPVSVRPLLISASESARVNSVAETFAALLEQVAAIYCSSETARSLFPAYQEVEPLISSLPAFRPIVQICRLDGVIDEEGNYEIFETGADGPGGVIQNGMTGRLWLEAATDLGVTDHLTIGAQPLVDQPDLLVQQLLTAHSEQFGRLPDGAAVVNLNGRWTNEVGWIANGLRDANVPAEVVDAGTFRPRPGGGGLMTPSGLEVTLTYNKPEQNDLVREQAARCYLEAAARNELAFINPPIAYTVLGDKATLAVMSDPQFAGEFTVDEQAFLQRHVPWIRALRPGRTSGPDGEVIDLAEFVLRNRERLVLKPVNLTRGENVLVGPRTAAPVWASAVTDALVRYSYVVQRHVPLPEVDVPLPDGHTAEMVHGLDVYVFGGRSVGFQCRASLDPVVNIGRRGTLLPPVVVE